MEVSKNIKYSHGTVSVRGVFNKKSSETLVFINYSTKEDRLLYTILEKFIAEKCLDAGFNVNNQMASAFATTNGIVFTVPDNKIFSCIQQVHKYVLTTALNQQQQKYAGKGSYSRLHSDIRSFSVMFIGKCRLTHRALGNSKDKKIDNFVKGIDAISPKNIDDFDVNNPYVPETIDCGKMNSAAKMAFSVCYSHIPFVFKDNRIVLLNPFAICQLKDRETFKNAFQGKVKSFQAQFGAFGTPAANDTGHKKYNEKCREIVAANDFIANIYSTIHGFSFKYPNQDAIKTVNSDALRDAKSVKF